MFDERQKNAANVRRSQKLKLNDHDSMVMVELSLVVDKRRDEIFLGYGDERPRPK